jgi:death on curing protein
MKEGYRWIELKETLIIHETQLIEHGGKQGFKDESLLEAALMRPRHKAVYASLEIFDLAAAYAWGIVRDHPFSDGNKRVALVICETFLELNGYLLEAADEECVRVFLEMAAGDLSESEMAHWIKTNSKKAT